MDRTENVRRARIAAARLRMQAARWLEGAIYAFAVLAVMLSFLVFLVLASFTAVHLNRIAETSAPPLFEKVTATVLHFWGVSSKSPQEYATAVAVGLNGLLVGASVLFAVQPFMTFYIHRRKLRHQQSVQEFRVYEDGVDDTKVLEKYYRDAEKITVFSGDFDWIRRSEKLQANLREKRGRVNLVSYKNEEEVAVALGPDLFNEFRRFFYFGCPARIKCSLVEYPGHKVFLYKSLLPEGDQMSKVVCVVAGAGNSRYLLDALAVLCEQLTASCGSTQQGTHHGLSVPLNFVPEPAPPA